MPLRDFRSVFLPYCLKRQEDGRYAVLNREYQPLGHGRKNYQDYPNPVTFNGLTTKKIEKIAWNGKPQEGTGDIFLYNDRTIPTRSREAMKAYLDRLALLMQLDIKEDSREF